MGRPAVRDGGLVALYGHSAHSRSRTRAVPLRTLAVKEREFNGPALLLGMKGMKLSPVVTGIDFDTHTWTNQSLRKGASGVRAASRCRHGLFWGTVFCMRKRGTEPLLPVHSQILNAAFARIEPSLFSLRSPLRTAAHLRSMPPSFLHSTPFSRNSSVPMS